MFKPLILLKFQEDYLESSTQEVGFPLFILFRYALYVYGMTYLLLSK